MAKIAILSDLHVHNWQEHSVVDPNTGVPSRLRDCVAVLGDVRKHCVTQGIKTLVFGGDLFHKRGVVFTQCFNLVVAELTKFKASCIDVLMVDGNHDHADKAGTVHSVQGLAAAGLVTQIALGKSWANWTYDDDGLIISAFSYVDNAEQFEQRLTDSDLDYRKHHRGQQRIGIFHQGFQNARVGTALEYIVKEPLDPHILKSSEFDYAFCGHYHGRQPIGKLKRATYIGSPLEHVRGETVQKKGFIEYDSDKKEWKLIPLKRPQFVTLNQQMIDEKDLSIVEGNFVDVVYDSLPKAPEIYVQRLIKEGARGVKLAPLPKRRSLTSKRRLDVDLSTDAVTLLKRYLDHKGFAKKKRLLDLGLQLLEEVTT